MVAFAPSEGGAATPHNGGDAGGWGTGNQTGTGFNPQGQGIEEAEAGLLISQMAALDNITTVRIELTINGVPQPAIIADATTTKDVLPRIGPNDTVSGTAYINLSNGPTRVAQLEETHVELGKALPFKVPYYYRCVNSSGTEIVPSTEYFSRDGINLSDHTTENMAGWLCTNDGTMHNGSYVSGVRGDITLTPVYNAPDCTITVTGPGTATETALGSGIYAITNISDSFSFLVGLSDGSSFPAGTNTTWQINGTAFSGTSPETCGAAPDDVGITVASIGSNATNASTMTINCIINIPGEPQAAATKTIKVFKKIDMPTTFSIDVTAPATASEDTAATGKYAVTAPADTFTFAASLSGGATFPTGTVFNWTINAGGTTITKTGQSVTVAPSSGAALSTIYASPTSWTISCAISHPDMANATAPSDTKTISLYKENPLKMTVGTPSTGTSYSGDIYKITDMSNTFSFKATEEDGSPITGSSFKWYVNGLEISGQTSSSFDVTPTALGLTEATMGTNQTNATPVEVKCVVTRPSGNSVPVVKTIKVFKPVTLTGFDIYVDNNIYTGTAYPVYNTATPINFSVFTAAGLPTGTVYNWTITNSSTGTSVTKTGDNVNVTPTEMGSIGTTEATATSFTVSCTISHPDTAVAGDTVTENLSPSFSAYKFTIPDITVTLSTPPAGLNQAPEGTYLVRIADLTTETFGFSASPTSGTMPSGVKYTWTIGTTELNSTPYTEQTISKTLLQMGVVTAPTTQQTLTVKCTVSHDSLAAGTEKYNTIDVKIIGTYSVSFAARGGTPAPATQDVASGGTATEPATAPSKTGATFGGWYTSTDGGTTLSATAYDFDTPVTANVTLYAKWIYTDFTGTYDEFLAAEFVQGNDETTPYTITITSFTEQDYPSILDALTASTDTNYKGGIYVNLDLTGYTGSRIGYYGTSTTKDHKEYILEISYSNTITNIYKAYCSGFSNLASVTLPSSLQKIGQDCFYDCINLTSISIPSTVTEIERYAFRGSGLTDGGLSIGGTNSWNQYDFFGSSVVSGGVPLTAEYLTGSDAYKCVR